MIAFEHDQLLQFFSKTTEKAFMQLSFDAEAVDPVRGQVWNILDMFDEEVLDTLTHTGAITIMLDTIEEAHDIYLKVIGRLGILPDVGLALIVTYKGESFMHLAQDDGVVVYLEADMQVPQLMAA